METFVLDSEVFDESLNTDQYGCIVHVCEPVEVPSTTPMSPVTPKPATNASPILPVPPVPSTTLSVHVADDLAASKLENDPVAINPSSCNQQTLLGPDG